MKLFGMALHKLTLSIGLLAASLMLAAPAQAETWACTDKFDGNKPFVFVRKGKIFELKGSALTFKILGETHTGISLGRDWYNDGKGPDLTNPIPYVKEIASWTVHLVKHSGGRKRFLMDVYSVFPEFRKNWTGECTVY